MTVTAQQLIETGLVAPHLFAHRQSEGRYGGNRYAVWNYIQLIGEEIARAVHAGDGRLIINLGPGSGKSELISFWTPAWHIARWPEKRVILGTAKSDLADRYGGMCKNLFEGNPTLNVRVSSDSKAKAAWMNDCGGGMKAVGVGTSVLGFRGHLFVVDDPYGTWKQAQSPTYRKDVANWYTATVSNRLEPGGSVIILHHRMHPKDLTNYVLSGEDGSRWKVISLPSIAQLNDMLGRKPGEALCPERYNVQKLEAIRKEMRWAWEPMHQQNPLGMVAGGAYSRFGPHNIDNTVGFRSELPLHLSVDFNINPGMHMVLGQYDPVQDRAWAFDEIHGTRMSVEGMCAELARKLAAWPVRPSEIVVFGDPSGSSGWAGTGESLYDILFKGLDPLNIKTRSRVPTSHPGIPDRVNVFNYTLRDIESLDGKAGVVRYFVHPQCDRLLVDLASVQLDSKGKIDKSDDSLTHASDAEGYRLHELRGFGGPSKLPQGQFIY